MKQKNSLILSICLALSAFAGLLIFPAAAAEGARSGLALCGSVIIPSLFPFTVLAGLLLELGLPDKLGRFASPLMKRLFHVSGQGSVAFFLGILGGYPLGAVTVSQMHTSGQLTKKEAERLLGFCDNSGPAFIIAMAGTAVFKSSAAGFFLYGTHIIAAILTGVLLRGKQSEPSPILPYKKAPGFSAAFSASVKRGTAAAVTVSGFVVFFSVLMALLNAAGFLPSLCGRLSSQLGLELHFTHSLVNGFLEIGSGIGSMTGLSLNAQNLAMCAFVLGWGGLSVQAQAAAVIKESGLSASKHFLGKLLHGVLSALITYFTFALFF